MWNIGAAGLALDTNYYVIAHIQEGDDHLFVQYTSDLGPVEVGAILIDRQVVVTHAPYFRAETPLEGEVIVLEGSDETICNWSGFDRDAATDGIVQVFMAPAGTDVLATIVAFGTTNDWTGLAGEDGTDENTINDWYWLFPTTFGVESAGAGNGPTIISGAFTLDVSDITDDMDEPGNEVRPKGFYDVWYFTTYAAGFNTELPVKADGVIRFTGSTAAATNFSLTPNATVLTKGETVTVSVIAKSASDLMVRLLSIAIDVPSTYFTVVDQGSGAPFIDESSSFIGTDVLKNTMTNVGGYWKLDFIEVDDSPGEDLYADDLTVAQFQVTVNSSGSGPDLIDNLIQFVNTETRTTGISDVNGNEEVLSIADPAANLKLSPPGTIAGQVELDVLSEPAQWVDIHVMPLGSYTPISDADFLQANGGANADGSISVQLGTDGAYTVSLIPTGDYDALVHKDYHVDQMEENVEVRAVNTTTLNFRGADMLIAGDIAGRDDDTDASTATVPDNQIGPDDITAVSNAFDTSPGHDDWNPAADFNADDYVFIYDYNLVVTNSGTNGEGLIYKGIPRDANENTVAKLIALNTVGDEATFAVELENLSSIHAYAVEMDFNPDHWELVSFTDGMADYNRAVELYKPKAFGGIFASAIIGRDVIRTPEMTLMTMTLKAKVDAPDEISISDASLIDANRELFKAIIGGPTELPVEFSLSQNFPNPFNPTTTISFSLPEAGHVKLAVYNLLGQEVRSLMVGDLNPGTYKAIWNSRDNLGRKVSTGMYFYRLVVDNQISATKKMVLLK